MGKTTMAFKKGDYVLFTINRYGVETSYVAIVRSEDGELINEYCSAVLKSTDEDLEDNIDYGGYTHKDCVSLIRKAASEEAEWLDALLMEMDGNRFDKGNNEIVHCGTDKSGIWKG